MKEKPVIIIDFDTAIYKNNKGRFYRTKNDTSEIPKVNKKLKLLFDSLKQNFKVVLCSKKNMHTAVRWIEKNKLHKHCLYMLRCDKKLRHTFFINKF